MEISNDKTVYIKFLGQLPKKFELIRKNGVLEFERFLDGKTPRIKFNVPEGGNFVTNVPVEIIKVVPIERPSINITLPDYERNRIKDFVIIDNPALDGTPARVWTNEGIIEKGKNLYKYIKPMRIFFLLHEVGHFYYKTEQYCDLFALSHFLEMGYNMSTAMYCLTNVLKRTPQNMERVLFIYNKLIKQ